MAEEHHPKHTGPTSQTQIPTYKGFGSCGRWRQHLKPHHRTTNSKKKITN